MFEDNELLLERIDTLHATVDEQTQIISDLKMDILALEEDLEGKRLLIQNLSERNSELKRALRRADEINYKRDVLRESVYNDTP